jgi:hypothetical protein
MTGVNSVVSTPFTTTCRHGAEYVTKHKAEYYEVDLALNSRCRASTGGRGS